MFYNLALFNGLLDPPALFCIGWTMLAVVLITAHDKIRTKRSQPRPEAVDAEMARFLALGEDESQANLGREMVEAALAGDMKRHRLLKELSRKIMSLDRRF